MGKAVQVLIDTGCTTNLLGKHIFERLPMQVRQGLQECHSHGVMADGTHMPFYGMISLELRLRDVKVKETFVVGAISEDAILGMPFLTDHGCSLDFSRPTLKLAGRELTCTDRHGRLLLSKVQILRDTMLPPNTEVLVNGKVNSQNFFPLGVVEAQQDGPMLAASVSRPDEKGRLVVRCLNPTDQPWRLKAGTAIGEFTGIEEPDAIQDTATDPRVGRSSFPAHVRRAATRDEPGVVPEHLQGLYRAACQGCKNSGQAHQVAQLLQEYGQVFSTGDDDTGRTTLVEHSIPVQPGTRPIRQPPHRLGPEKEAEAERQVEALVGKGLIEPADGAWSSPVVLVRKKDSTWRFCVDYRKLNAVTQQDAYPLPRIDESLDALAGSRFFSTLDLVSGYWQVPMDADAQEKAAFVTRSGFWKWKVLPFGLTSAPATFQRLMEKVLQGLHWQTLLLYLDDVIVIAPDFNTHIQRLREVLQRLQQAGLKLKPSKCELLQTEVRYLGHVVSANGVATDPDKVQAVREWPEPHTAKQLMAFLGTVGYYRQYIEDYATLAKPLTVLTGKGIKWSWDSAAQGAFSELKRRLVEAPVLGYPDPRISYVLDTDASDVGVGAVLSQVQDSQERVIAYYSKTLAPPERNYCVTRRELLAVVKAVRHFRPYLYGRRFKLRTDHASLQWLCQRREPSHQVARWLEILAEFNYQLEHRAGTKHGNADGLSRRECQDCKQCGRIERRDGGPIRFPGTGPTDCTPPDQQTGQDGPRTPPTISTLTISNPRANCQELGRLQSSGTGTVAAVYQAVKQGVDIEEDVLAAGSPELRKLHQQRGAMRVLDNGLLEIRLSPHGTPRWNLVCPLTLRHSLIWQTHSMAHSGINKTLARLHLTWYWPGMSADTRRLIRSCEVCQSAKHGGTAGSVGTRRLYAGRPWQVVAVDLVGPMPETPRGNRWILVLTDHFTRWQDALAIADATAPTVASVLDERVFCYLGLPERIHSDQGAQFQSQLMQELCQLWEWPKPAPHPTTLSLMGW